MTETCYLCDDSKRLVPPADANIGLCRRHWSRWIALFTAPLNPRPPCAAHLILEATNDAG